MISGGIAYALRLSLAVGCADSDHHHPLAAYGPPLTNFFLAGVVFLEPIQELIESDESFVIP